MPPKAPSNSKTSIFGILIAMAFLSMIAFLVLDFKLDQNAQAAAHGVGLLNDRANDLEALIISKNPQPLPSADVSVTSTDYEKYTFAYVHTMALADLTDAQINKLTTAFAFPGLVSCAEGAAQDAVSKEFCNGDTGPEGANVNLFVLTDANWSDGKDHTFYLAESTEYGYIGLKGPYTDNLTHLKAEVDSYSVY